jgi:hypothetical protein
MIAVALSRMTSIARGQKGPLGQSLIPALPDQFQLRLAKFGWCLHGKLPSRTFQPTDLGQGQPEQDEHSDHHHQALEDIGPNDRPKPAVGRVSDHRDCKTTQADEIVRIGTADPEPLSGRSFHRCHCLLIDGNVAKEGGHDFRAGLELGQEIEKHEEQDQEGGNVSNLVARKTFPQQLGDGDCSRDASHLVDALGKQPQGHKRDHHITTDPPRQRPAMGVDQGRKPHEASTACQGRRVGQGKSPHPEVTSTQVVLAHEWLPLPGPPRKEGDHENNPHIAQETNQRGV